MTRKTPSSSAKAKKAADKAADKASKKTLKADDNTAVKRMGRYARVGTTMSGLAAKMAGEKFFGVSIDRDTHALTLTKALGNLRGPLMKVAQLLATIPDALPPEYAQALRSLQAQAPPMGWPFVKRRMQAELGADWEGKFHSFTRDAVAAASLGQVHKGVIDAPKSGKSKSTIQVACKLQYPDMESAVEADLKQLKMIFSMYEVYDKAIQTQNIIPEIAARLHEELDYVREAKQCAMYAGILQDEPNVHVPVPIPSLSGKRLLTTTWLDGAPILDMKNASQEMRNTIALNLFRAWYVPLYRYGIIHGDPHPGNYTVRPDGSINLLDFGCVRVFPPRFIKGILDLYHALRKDDHALTKRAYAAWGFENLTDPLVETLNIWARFLYQAVMDDNVRAIGKSEGTVYGREKAMQVHQALREHGGITVPREFIFMDRSALGLGSVFIHLQAQINWHRVFEELTAEFDMDAMEARQKALLQKYDIV